VLISTNTPTLVVVARSSDLHVPANQILASLTATFGGRGGGKAELAQGGGLDGDTHSILNRAREALVSLGYN